MKLDIALLQEQLTSVQEALANTGATAQIQRDEIVASCSADELLLVLQTLRDNTATQMKFMPDITAVDHLNRSPRFDLVYQLCSPYQNFRIRLKCAASDEVPVPSCTGLFNSAIWPEREVWDMYGIFFSDHPDLRRILTDYGFEGHPLRKDFPLTGFVEVRYDEERKEVVYEPVVLQQEFRSFDFLSPWEGAKYILPGDEKSEAAE